MVETYTSADIRYADGKLLQNNFVKEVDYRQLEKLLELQMQLNNNLKEERCDCKLLP